MASETAGILSKCGSSFSMISSSPVEFWVDWARYSNLAFTLFRILALLVFGSASSRGSGMAGIGLFDLFLGASSGFEALNLSVLAAFGRSCVDYVGSARFEALGTPCTGES